MAVISVLPTACAVVLSREPTAIGWMTPSGTHNPVSHTQVSQHTKCDLGEVQLSPFLSNVLGIVLSSVRTAGTGLSMSPAPATFAAACFPVNIPDKRSANTLAMPSPSATILFSSLAKDFETMITIEFLPPEILSIVLEQACRDASPNTEQVAQTLGWVSKLWRTIVFSTPSIWTVFYVGDRRQTKPIHNAMGRSGDLPLDVHIVDQSSKIGPIREQLSDLANKADHWRTLQISHPDAILILEQLSPPELPGIQTLSVKATPRQYNIPLNDYYPFVPDYPSPPTFSLSWASLQLPRLQDLEFNDIILEPKAVVEFLDFLQACPDLRRLALGHVWERGAYDTPRSVTLHSLRELELRGISSPHVLRWIVAPQLQRLVVEKKGLPRAWAPVEIGTNYATATNVTLIRFSTLPAVLRSIIQAVPLVSSLKLLEFDFRSPDALSAEAVLREQPLPYLTSLHIQGTFSLFQLQKAVELHRATLSNVEVHCLDLGLPEESLAKDYQERDEALKWLKEQSWFTFKVNQDSGIIGDRYRSHQDQKWRRKMECGPNKRQYLL